MYLTQRLVLQDSSQIGEARRSVTSVAIDQKFTEIEYGRAAIIATELASNIVRHAGSGEILCNRVESANGVAGVEILAVDKGPGVRNLAQCLADGYSTGGSAGVGLGAVRRLAQDFDVFSQPEKGTIVLARLWAGADIDDRQYARPKVVYPLSYSAIAVPYPGENVSGDSFAVRERPPNTKVMVADGLGHGLLAEAVGIAAVRGFHEHSSLPSTDMMQLLHQELRSTRGAALAIASIDPQAQLLTYVGIGNISGCVLDANGNSKSMVSLSGICGHEMRKVQPFTYPWSSDSTLVMHSDGLSASWNLRSYPGLVQRDPALVAAMLYRDVTRGRDDATIIVFRQAAGNSPRESKTSL